MADSAPAPVPIAPVHPDAGARNVMAEALVERGIMTSAQASAALVADPAASGMPPPAPAPPKHPDAAARQAMADALIARGVMTPEQVQAALADPEFDPTQQTPPAARDAADLDGLLFEAPASPQQYTFEPTPPGVQSDPQQEQAVRAALHAENFDAASVRHVSKLYNAACAAPPDARQRDAIHQQTTVTLRRAWPGEAFDANLKLAQGEVQRLAERFPGIVHMLEASNLGNDAWLIQHMAARGRARAARAARGA